MQVVDVKLNQILVTEDFNARKDLGAVAELAESVKRHGILQPLVVKDLDTTGSEHRYGLIAGHRRLEAARLADFESVPVVIWKGEDGVKGNEALMEEYLVNLVENAARENITTYDLAMRLQLLADEYELKGAALSRKLGGAISTGHINNLIRVLERVADPILEEWREESAARARGEDGETVYTTDFLFRLAKLEDEEAQIKSVAKRKQALGLVPVTDEDGETEDEDGDEDDGGEEVVSRRPSANMLQKLHDSLKSAVKEGIVDKSEGTLALKCLAFSLGKALKVKVGSFAFDPKKDGGSEESDAE